MNRAEAMEEALKKIEELSDFLDIPENDKRLLLSPSHSYVAVQIRRLIRDALYIPRRNCDKGTADEQMSRYCKFTDRYNPCSYKGYARCAEDCPIHIKLRQEGNGELQCKLEWAQMPYEESNGVSK